MSRLINRLRGRVYGWFDSKDAQPTSERLPAKFDPRARLLLQNLEDRSVPATFTVNVLTDAGPATTGVGAGNTGDLRYCIIQAAATPGSDVIDLTGLTGTNTIDLSLIQGGTSALFLGTASSTDGLTINGPTGAGNSLTVSTASIGTSHTTFNLGAATGTPSAGALFTINNITLTGGSSTVSATGGAITMTTQNLTLNNVTIKNNTVTGTTSGGAIYLTTGTLTANSSVIGGTSSADANVNTSTGTTTGQSAGIGSNGAAIITINNSTIAFNSSAGYAGAIGATTANVTVTNSNLSSNSATNAGAIAVNTSPGKLTVTGSTFDSNFTTANGSAIRWAAGTTNAVTISKSTISNNSSSGGRAALFFTSAGGTFNIDSSTISGNTSNSTSFGGGAIYMSGTLNLTNSLISGNSNAGSQGGGAIYAWSSGTINVTNSTIAFNSSAGSGAIRTQSAAIPVNVYNSTITGNVSNGDGAGISNYGASNLTLDSSVVAGNTAGGVESNFRTQAWGTINANNSAWSLGTGPTGSFSGTSGGNVTGNVFADFLLDAALAPNNGTGTAVTQTVAITGVTSALVDKGRNSKSLTTDQRGGGVDAVNFPRSKGATDIGAFEAFESPFPSGSVTTAPTVTLASPSAFDPYQFTVTYTGSATNLVNISTVNGVNKNNAITISGPNGYTGTANWVSDSGSNATSVTAVYQIVSLPGGGWDYADNGNYVISSANSVVKNTPAGNAVPNGPIGSFNVAIPLTIIVDTDNDVEDPTDGVTSLREALVLADGNTSNDIINFSTSFFSTTKTITLTSPLPDLVTATSGTITLNGTGSAKVIIDAATIAGTRAFNTATAPANTLVTISGLTVQNASAVSGAALNIGDENVTLNDVTLTGNTSSGAGGAIYVASGGKLSITNSTISKNSATGNGGAIRSATAGPITVSGSTISDNSGAIGGAWFNSGGLVLTIDKSTLSGNTGFSASWGGGFVYQTSGNLTITNSTLSGNSTNGSNGGGAVYAWSAPTVTISNSTFYANSATQNGGAIRINAGPLNLYNSTLTNNSAGVAGGAISFISTGIFTMESTVVAGNTAGANPNEISSTAGTQNVTNSAWVAPYTPNGINTGNITNKSLAQIGLVGPGSYGGPTQTFTLSASSALLDKGSNSKNFATDQRGQPRDQNQAGGSPTAQGIADIGAVEYGIATIPSGIVTVAPNVTAASPAFTPYQFTVQFTSTPGSLIDISTVRSVANKANAIVVTGGPDGFASGTAQWVSDDSGGVNAATVNVVYQINVLPDNASPAVWSQTDNGLYTIAISGASTIGSTNSKTVPAGSVGTFRSAIPSSFTVTTDSDVDDPSDGQTTLREALAQANASLLTADTINFAASFNNAAKTITLISGALQVSDSVNIVGPTGGVTVNANNASRVLDIDDLSTTTTSLVSISNTTLTGGTASSGTGGAVRVSAGDQLSLTDSSITNSKITGNGAAIGFINSGTNKLSLTRTTLSGNSASGAGGGIDSGSAGLNLTITDSVIASNTASSGGAAGLAGNAALVVNITGSTISGNSASGSGGALRFYGGAISISNSTISGNTSGATGGAMNFFQVYAASVLNIRNSTITLNKATTNGGGIGRTSATNFTAANINIESSIIAQNVNASTPDLFFTTNSQAIAGNNNLVGVLGVGNFTLTGSNNLTGTLATPLNAQLSSLAGNGGYGQTHALLAGSPAINAGTNIAPTLTYDQRGVGYPRQQGAAVDIGSYEYDPTAPAASGSGFVNVSADLPGVNNPYSFNVTYTIGAPATITYSTINGNNSAVQITGPGGFTKLATFVSATPAGNSDSITATYKFNPHTNPGDPWLGSDNGTYTVKVLANQIKASNNNFVPLTTVGSFNVTIPVTYTVNNNDDLDDGDPNNGLTSLREAMTLAENDSAPSKITFSTALGYFDGTPAKSVISLGSPLPLPTFPVDIVGISSTKSVIDAASTGSRVLNLSTAVAGTAFAISNLGLTGGSVAAGGGGGLLMSGQSVTLTNVAITGNTSNSGGGIYGTSAAGTLTISGSTISNNSTTGAGGAFRINGTSVTMTGSVLSTNTASGGQGGGGIFSSGATLTIDQSTITGNTHTGTAYGGGGLYVTGGSLFEVKNSTITGNSTAGVFSTVEGGGGGIYIFTSPTVTNIINTTITGNTAPWGGGFSAATTGTFNIKNSTIYNNEATNGSGGGGISLTDASTINIDSTIVGGNSSGGVANDFRSINNPTFNVTYSAWTDGFTPNGTNTSNKAGITTAAMGLDTLKNNGGPTETIALLAGSVLVNAANPVQSQLFDQRGTGFPRVSGTAADIGAFESDGNTPTAAGSGFVNVSANLPGVNNPYTFTITYSIAAPATINYASINGNNSLVEITGPGGFDKFATFVSATPAGNASSIVATYKFNPGTNPGDPWTSALNGNYSAKVLGGVVTASNSTSVPESVVGNFVVSFPIVQLVDTDADTIDPLDGKTSLREAITATLGGGGDDVINFDNTVFASSKTILLTSTLPDIDGPLTINGPGASKVTIDGAASYRIFNTLPAPTGTVININGVTMQNGSAPAGEIGGALLVVDENVTLNNSIITGNKVTDDLVNYYYGAGGALAVNASAGKLTLNNCTVSSNSSENTGGAIFVGASAALTLNNTTLSNNSAGADGGGIFLAGGTPTLRITQSTLSGNSSGADGGAIYFFSGGSLLLDRSTVSGNTAGGTAGGGGIYFWGTVSTPVDGIGFKIRNSTISGNSASGPGGGLVLLSGSTANVINVFNSTIYGNTASNGGGIQAATAETINITSTIITGNVGAAGADINMTAGVGTALNSAIEVIGGAALNYSSPTNISAANSTAAALGLTTTLAANGATTTQTHAISSTGTAYNAGSNPDAQATDQRGTGFVRSVGQTDIGAFEVQGAVAPVVTGFVVNDGAAQRSRLTKVVVNFASPVDAAQFQAVGAVTFTRTGVATNNIEPIGTVVNTSNGLIVSPATGSVSSITLTFQNIDNAGIDFGSLSDGRWQLAVTPASYTSPNTPADTQLRRLFGNVDNDTTVGGTDFGFYPPFGAIVGSPFDFNNDGSVQADDFGQFGNRYGFTLV